MNRIFIIVLLILTSHFSFSQLKVVTNNDYLYGIDNDKLMLVHRKKNTDPNINEIESFGAFLIFGKSELETMVNTSIFFNKEISAYKDSIERVSVLIRVIFKKENTTMICASFLVKIKGEKSLIIDTTSSLELTGLNSSLENIGLDLYIKDSYSPYGKTDSWWIHFK